MANGGNIEYTIGFKVDKTGLQQIQNELSQLSKLTTLDIQKMNPSMNIKQAHDAMVNLQAAVKEVQGSFQSAFDTKIGVLNLQKFQQGLKSLNLNQIQQSFAAIGPQGSSAFLKISQAALTMNVQLKQTNSLMNKMGITLINTLKWTFSSSLINRFTGAVQKAIGYVEHLDSSLNDIRIVTKKSSEEMESFAEDANKAAQALGKATTDYTEASLIYYQQGLSDEEVKARAETTLKAANVTGQATATVSEQLTAVWNGFKVQAEDTEKYVDKLAAVAAMSASNLQELSVGMSKVASAASNLGVDIDQLTAQISTIVSVTRQAPESVGTALKTIYARISDLKLGGTDEDGVDLGKVSGGLDQLGIHILDSQGDLRELGQVIEEVAEKWDGWTTAQQAAIAQLMAGKRQYNNLVALFSNWDIYEKAIDTSRNATGELQRQQDIYMESTEAHLEQLKAQWEDMYDSLFDADTINTFSDALRGVLSLLTKVIDTIGGGSTVITGLIGFILNKFSPQITSQILMPLINNFRAVKMNAEAFKQVMENANAVIKAQATTAAAQQGWGDQAAQAMAKAQIAASQYWDVMTTQEKNETQDLIRNIGFWEDQAAQIKANANAVDELLLKQEDLDLKNIGNKTNANGDRGVTAATEDEKRQVIDFLEKEIDKVNELRGIYTELSNAAKNANNAVKTGKGVRIENIKVINDELKSMASKLEELRSTKIIDEKDYTNYKTILDNLIKQIDALEQKGEKYKGKKVLFSQSDIANLRVFDNLLQRIATDLGKDGESVNQTGEKLEKIMGIIKTLGGEVEKEEYRIRKRVQARTQLIGSLTQSIHILQSAANISKTLFDNSVKDGEKFSKLLTSLVFIAPMAASAVNGISTALKGLDIAMKSSTIGLILGALALAIGGISAVFTVFQNKAKRQAEIDTQLADSAHQYTEALREQEEHLKEIKDLYDDLNQQIKDNEISSEDARLKVYDLCKQYELQDLAIKALISDYEDLNDIIDKAQNDNAAKELDAITAEKGALLQKAVSNAAAELGETSRDVIDGVMTIDLSWMGSASLYGDSISANIYGEQRRKLKEGLASLGIEIDEWGHASIQKIIEVAATQEEALYNILNSIDTKASNEIRNLLKSVDEEIKEYKTLIEDSQNLAAEQTAGSLFDPNEVNSLKEYYEVLHKLQSNQELLTLFDQDSDKLNQWINRYLYGIDHIKEYAQQADIASSIIDTTKFDENDITQQFDKRSDIEIQFLVDNVSLVDTYDTLDEFFDHYKDYIEELKRVDKIDVINNLFANEETKKKVSKFKQKDIDALFANEEFANSFSMSQDRFQELDIESQRAALIQYYMVAGELETEYEQQKKQTAIEDAETRRENLEELKSDYKDLIDSLKTEYGFESTNFLDPRYFSIISKGIVSSTEDIKIAMDGLTGQIKESDEEWETYQKILAEMKEAGVDTDRLTNMAEAFQRQEKFLAKAGVQAGKYQDVLDQFANQEKDLSDLTNTLKSLGMSWEEFEEQVGKALKTTNTQIDNLQTSYDALTGIIDDYNKTQVLSMDNLQTILNMDTAYLSALKIENGQMTLNEEALKNIALARLDEAEAEAYEQAISELNNQTARDAYNATTTAAQGLGDLGAAATQAAEAARNGIDAWRQYWAAATNNMGFTNGDYEKAVGDALRNKLQAIDTVRQQILNGKFKATVAKASKDKSSKSSKEPKTEKYLEREEDIYRVINEELDDIEATLGRIDKMASHEWGYDYQKSLEQQNKLLDKQLKKLQEKNKLQVQDLATRRKQLEMEGVSFSKDGSVMTNAEQILNNLYAGYNRMVDKYNKMSVSEQEAYKAQLDTEKNRVDAIEKKIDEYEDTFSDFQSTLDELQDVHYQQIENEVNQFNNMVDVHLELNDARKEWNDFWKEVVEDVQDNDFGGQIAASIKQLETLVGLNGDVSKSTVGLLTDQLNKTIEEVNKQIATAEQGGIGSIYGDDSKLSKEDLTNRMDQLMSALRDAKAEVNAIGENYLKQLDEEQELIDKQASSWETIDKHIEHNVELIKILSGEKAFDLLDDQYQQQYNNNLNSITTQRIATENFGKKVEEYKKWVETAEEGSIEWQTASDAYDKAVEDYIKATQALDDATIKALNDLKKQTENANAKVIDTLDKAMSKGLGLDLMEQEWKLINDEADKYYDNVERYLNMEEYTNVLNDAANAIGLSAENQQKLNQFRDQELAQLNEKEKLTSYDIEESKARLEILKAQIALEDAQANKSKMRLRRDSQGNYNYQYVADENAVNEGENGILTAKKSWYEIVKKRYQETSNDIIEIQKQQLELANQIKDAESQHDIERLNKLKELYNLNEKYREQRMAEAEKNKRDLYNGTAQYFANVENASILPQSEATVRKLIDEWAGSGSDSFVTAVTTAITELDAVQAKFVKNSDEIMTTSGRNYEDLKNKIDPTINSLKELAGTNDELATKIDDVNQKLNTMADNLRTAEQGYNTLKNSAVEALRQAETSLNQLANTYIQTQQKMKAAADAARSASAIPYTTGTTTTTTSNSGNGNAGRAKANNGNSLYTVTAYDNRGFQLTGYPKTYFTKDYAKSEVRAILNKRQNYSATINGPAGLLSLKDPTELSQEKFKKYNTGGYTGEWGTEGRLGILHQKELVLNENDTKNMLSAVQILRSIPYSTIAQSLLNSSSTASVLSSINSGISGLSTTSNNNETKTMIVNADFSGVHDADEIYKAFLELENYGLQNSYSVAPHTNTMY